MIWTKPISVSFISQYQTNCNKQVVSRLQTISGLLCSKSLLFQISMYAESWQENITIFHIAIMVRINKRLQPLNHRQLIFNNDQQIEQTVLSIDRAFIQCGTSVGLGNATWDIFKISWDRVYWNCMRLYYVTMILNRRINMYRNSRGKTTTL